MDALTRLAEVAEQIARRPTLIRQARDEGATWPQIAQALKMSRAGVIKLGDGAAQHQAQSPSAHVNPDAASPLRRISPGLMEADNESGHVT